jgi:zinc transporter, ZIP family
MQVIGALVPLALLAAFVGYFLKNDPGIGRPPAPIEDIAIERVVFGDEEIAVYARNVGAQDSTIALVMVNEAIWDHSISPGRIMPRFASVEIRIPYSWEESLPHTVTLLTETGLKFSRTIDVATRTPVPNAEYLGRFALIGALVGIVPVFLGILWYPFLRSVGDKTLGALLAFTIGLLVFLAVDSLQEAAEVAERLPDALHGKGLILVGLLGTLLGLVALGRRPKGTTISPTALAYLVAAGIGVHNLGEGLAIGAAYTLGNVALGSRLVVGFMLHNATEGLAIVTPILRSGGSFLHLVALGAIAGVPTIFGGWIGAFTYSDIFAVLFLAIGAGALLQVCWAVGAHMMRDREAALAWPNVLGFTGGLIVMYATSLLVT